MKTRGELLKYIERMAVEYAPKCGDSVLRNVHMNELPKNMEKYLLIQKEIDAILTDFVNYIGTDQGLDYGMYVKDLYSGRKIVDKRTSEEWQKLCKITILDPDGWDRSPENYQYSWYEELITREEWERRMVYSTVMGFRHGENIWEDKENATV